MSTPTTAMFRRNTVGFGSQREGYLWLLNRFAACVRNPRELLSNYAGSGQVRHYFGESPEDLFKASLVEKSGTFSMLACGWFANTNLSNLEKHKILRWIAQDLGLEERGDWSWSVERRAISYGRPQPIPVIYFPL
jgi:hypothetical protein